MIELRMDEAATARVAKLNLGFAWVMAVVFLLPAPLYLFTGIPWLAAVQFGLAAMFVPFTLALVRRSNRVTRMVFGDGTYALHGLWRTTRFTAAEATGVVTVLQMALGGGIAGSTHHLIVTGARKRLLILVGQMWSMEQLTTLADDLRSRGVPLIPIAAPITPARLRAWDRRTMPWPQAHPVAFGLLSGLGLIVVLVIGLIVVVAVFVALSRNG